MRPRIPVGALWGVVLCATTACDSHGSVRADPPPSARVVFDGSSGQNVDADHSGRATDLLESTERCGDTRDPAEHDSDLRLLLESESDASDHRVGALPPIEIVQGSQGGVHVDVVLEVESDDDEEKLVVEVVAETRLGCCDGPSVGQSASTQVLWPVDVGDERYRSGAYRVIFDENDAVHYASHVCCVVVTVAWDDVQLESSRPFWCVDDE